MPLAPCALLLLFLTACVSTQPVVKIGLVAPFEGRYRPIGYEAIYAARLAIREINARGGIEGRRIELVALDDRGDPAKSIEAARQLALDPQVVAVIGHYQPDSTDAAIGVYCAEGLPVIALQSAAALPTDCQGRASAFVTGYGARANWPDDALTFVSDVPDPNGLAQAGNFVSAYNSIPIDGTRAGPVALQTYDTMYMLFDALNKAGQFKRSQMAAALAHSDFSGLGAHFAFDQRGQLIDARPHVYRFDPERTPRWIP